MGYGQQERLKDIVEKEVEEKEQPTATKEEQNTDLTMHETEEDGCNRVEIAFNSPMTKFSEDSDINDLIECMLAHIRTS